MNYDLKIKKREERFGSQGLIWFAGSPFVNYAHHRRRLVLQPPAVRFLDSVRCSASVDQRPQSWSPVLDKSDLPRCKIQTFYEKQEDAPAATPVQHSMPLSAAASASGNADLAAAPVQLHQCSTACHPVQQPVHQVMQTQLPQSVQHRLVLSAQLRQEIQDQIQVEVQTISQN
nr:hypothetical protein CFP56_04664 [Quercus suber]